MSLIATFPRDLAAKLRHYATLRDRDPLSVWHHASEESRIATRMLSVAEVFARWPNWSGKTTWGAAAVISMLQGRPTLDGEPLPIVRNPAAAVLVLDYGQQKFSVQPAYLEALGEWPHRATYKGDGILSTLRVKPLCGGDDPAGWPMATFISQENPRAGTGARVPIVHADEPPVEGVWREFRKSKRYGGRSIRLITATPLVRRQWFWLREDYKGCYGAVHRGRVEVHMSDVRHARIVDASRYQELLDEYLGDPLIRARLTAEYVDTSGCSPWGDLYAVLDEMEAACREPHMESWAITREVDGDKGREKVAHKVQVERWEKASKGERYYIAVDPSLGINDERHDPGGLHVRRVSNGELVARYNGYCGAYGLGVLAAALARDYGDAVVDPETTGGWGGPVLTALTDCGYGNVARQRKEVQPGKWETQLGFKTTDQTRPAMFAATQEWLRDWTRGIREAKCPSRGVLQSLRDLILDERNRPVAGPGLHDEDAILWGHGCKLLLRRKPALTPRLEPEGRRTTLAKLLERDREESYPRKSELAVLRLRSTRG